MKASVIMKMASVATLLMSTLVTSSVVRTNPSDHSFDPQHARVFRGPEGSLFGYAVTLWDDSRGNKKVVIGAPRDFNSTVASSSHLPLGTVFLCNPSEPQCAPHPDLPFLSDSDHSKDAINFGPFMATQGMGFGESVHTASTPNSKLMVCAPRYPIKQVTSKRLYTRGACYVLTRADARPNLLVPYDDQLFHFEEEGKWWRSTDSVYFTATALFGFSSAFFEDNLKIVLGAPKALLANGILFKDHWMGSSMKSATRKISREITRAGIESFRLQDGHKEGWAVVVDKFGHNSKECVASSHPGAKDTEGKVEFYTKNLTPRPGKTLYGEEVGAMYGYVLASGDLDGDGASELLVGAPLSTGATLNNHRDAGKVYVYYAPLALMKPRESPLVLMGEEPFGRFGTALACIGDFDLDGYRDMAVGAPGGEGRVYIYRGGESGVNSEPAQILRASAFPSSLASFGMSVSGGVDVDGNGFPEVLVGAPQSDAAVLLRAAPVVWLEGRVEFDAPSVDLENKSCLLTGAQKVVCFALLIDLQYRVVNRNAQKLPVLVEVVLDGNQKRLTYYNLTSEYNVSGNSAIFVHHLDPEGHLPRTPRRIPVYLKQDKHKSTTPATAYIKVSLYHPPSSSSSSSSILAPLKPILSKTTQTVYNPKVALNCSDEATCFSRPNLVLNSTGPRELVVGEGEVRVEVKLEVREDHAYDAILEVEVPLGLSYQRVSGTSHLLPSCRGGSQRIITCTFPDVLSVGVKVAMTLVLTKSPVTLLTQADLELVVKLQVSSFSLDLDTSDNTGQVVINKISRVDLTLNSISEPENILAKESTSLDLGELLHSHGTNATSTLDELGPSLTHRFSLTNRGPTPLYGLQMVLGIPVLPSNLHVLYLTEELDTSSSVICAQPTLNPLNLTLPEEGLDDTLQTIEDEIEEEGEEEEEEDDEGYPSGLPQPPSPTTSNTINTRRKRRQVENGGGGGGGLLSPPPPPPPPFVAGGEEGGGKVNKAAAYNLTLDCNTVHCEEILCRVPQLYPGETVEMEVTGHLVVAMLKMYYRRALEDGFNHVALATSLNLQPDQPCVFVNGKGGGGPSCAAGDDTQEEEGEEEEEGGVEVETEEPVVNMMMVMGTVEELNTTRQIGQMEGEERHTTGHKEGQEGQVEGQEGEEEGRTPGQKERQAGQTARFTAGQDEDYSVTAKTRITIVLEMDDDGLSSLVEKPELLFICIFAGLLITIIISAVFYKIGFFTRRRISSEQRSLLRESVRRREERRSRRDPYEEATPAAFGGVVMLS